MPTARRAGRPATATDGERPDELQAGADGGEVVDITRNQSQSAEFEVWHFADLSSALAALHCSACF